MKPWHWKVVFTVASFVLMLAAAYDHNFLGTLGCFSSFVAWAAQLREGEHDIL